MPGVVNIAETLLAMHLKDAGIAFVRQYKYLPDNKFRSDFGLTGTNILVEVQGGIYPFKRNRKDGSEVMLQGAHGSIEGILLDNTKLNMAMLYGYRLLRFTPGDVGDGIAITFIKRVLLKDKKQKE